LERKCKEKERKDEMLSCLKKRIKEDQLTAIPRMMLSVIVGAEDFLCNKEVVA
jgi:hypothetical protein